MTRLILRTIPVFFIACAAPLDADLETQSEELAALPAEGSDRAVATLLLANHASRALLANVPGVSAIARNALLAARVGVDGTEGTPDDVAFGTLAELTAVYGVSNAAVRALASFAAASGLASSEAPPSWAMRLPSDLDQTVWVTFPATERGRSWRTVAQTWPLRVFRAKTGEVLLQIGDRAMSKVTASGFDVRTTDGPSWLDIHGSIYHGVATHTKVNLPITGDRVTGLWYGLELNFGGFAEKGVRHDALPVQVTLPLIDAEGRWNPEADPADGDAWSIPLMAVTDRLAVAGRDDLCTLRLAPSFDEVRVPSGQTRVRLATVVQSAYGRTDGIARPVTFRAFGNELSVANGTSRVFPGFACASGAPEETIEISACGQTKRVKLRCGT